MQALWLADPLPPAYIPGVLLPNAESAFVDLRKLADYLLDSIHPVGRHKAIVFRRALGFTKADATTLRDLLIRAVQVYDATLGRSDEFGQRYIVDFPVSTPMGAAILRSAWIVLRRENFPRLVTCFVLPD